MFIYVSSMENLQSTVCHSQSLTLARRFLVLPGQTFSLLAHFLILNCKHTVLCCNTLQLIGFLRDACSKVFGPARPRACKALLPEKALHGSHHGLGGFTTTYLEIRYSVHKLCQGCARLAESTLKHSFSLFPLADVVDGQNPHPHNGQNHYLTMDNPNPYNG